MPKFRTELSRVTPISMGFIGIFLSDVYDIQPAH